jgi:Uma2 family endonuclease
MRIRRRALSIGNWIKIVRYKREPEGAKEMPLEKEKHYSEQEYEDYENEGLTEYIDGKIIAMAPPSRIHQKLLGEITWRIRSFLEGKSCEIYQSPFDVRLELENGIKRLEPDISIICDKNKLTANGCSGAPDLVIEIVSPSNLVYDYVTKASWYREAGVKEYWIVNPMNKKVTVFKYEIDAMDEYTFENIVPMGIFENFSIDFSQIDLS